MSQVPTVIFVAILHWDKFQIMFKVLTVIIISNLQDS